MKRYTIFVLLILVGCGPTTKKMSEMNYDEYSALRDEALNNKSISEEKLTDLIDVQNEFGQKAMASGKLEEAESIFSKTLELDQHSKDAKYGLAMIKGHRFYKQGSKTSLWDALEQYGKASYYSPARGEPHYWMGRSYEKKDDGDYDLIIEAYESALNKAMHHDLIADAEGRLVSVKKQQKTYEDFWQ